MSEKKKVTIVNLITGSRIIGTFLLPIITSVFGSLGTAIYIASLWLTDAIDGFLAKHKWKVSTIFGANLDAFSDKLFGIGILLYLRNFYPFMIMPLISEFAIFGVNWHYGRKGSDVKSSYLGKFKTAVLDISTVLAILSTLTNGLAFYIPIIINLVTLTQAATLVDYVNSNREYLKTHTPKNDVSNMGFFETIKKIIKKLGDKNLYSPAYFKEHKNEPLLDMLLNNEKQESEKKLTEKEDKTNNDVKENNESCLTIAEQNELKIEYDLTTKELDKIKEYMEVHNINKDKIKEYLSLYIQSLKNNYRNSNKIEDFFNKQEITKQKKK